MRKLLKMINTSNKIKRLSLQQKMSLLRVWPSSTPKWNIIFKFNRKDSGKTTCRKTMVHRGNLGCWCKVLSVDSKMVVSVTRLSIRASLSLIRGSRSVTMFISIRYLKSSFLYHRPLDYGGHRFRAISLYSLSCLKWWRNLNLLSLQKWMSTIKILWKPKILKSHMKWFQNGVLYWTGTRLRSLLTVVKLNLLQYR